MEHKEITIGENVLGFINYNSDKLAKHTVNVVMYVAPPKARMQVIVVEKNGYYQDFYYNGGWKMLTEYGGQQCSWEEEEIGVPTPDFIKNKLSPNNGIAKEYQL